MRHKIIQERAINRVIMKRFLRKREIPFNVNDSTKSLKVKYNKAKTFTGVITTD